MGTCATGGPYAGKAAAIQRGGVHYKNAFVLRVVTL